MYDEQQINDAIETALDILDITPSMFREAEGHYRTMAAFLCSNGAESDISAFGSIATGTVTRPYSPDEDSYFDFDVLCKRSDLDKDDCTPNDVRQPIENALLSSNRYQDMTDTCDECLTVEYVLNGKEGGFRLDINPCVANAGKEPEIAHCETFPEYSSDTVSIARRNPDSWLGSNPQGLIDWFNNKNERFAVVSRVAQQRAILEKAPGVYASVEDVPRALERSSLQRAIQLAKRSRDVHYHNLAGMDKKPPSCMLAVLMTRTAEDLSDEASVLDIVRAFASAMSNAKTRASAGHETIVGSKGNWRVDNPVYAGSLIDEDWTDSDMEAFFHWTSLIAKDLEDLALGGERSMAAARALFGKGSASVASLGALPETSKITAPVAIVGGHKPWRSME